MCRRSRRFNSGSWEIYRLLRGWLRFAINLWLRCFPFRGRTSMCRIRSLARRALNNGLRSPTREDHHHVRVWRRLFPKNIKMLRKTTRFHLTNVNCVWTFSAVSVPFTVTVPKHCRNLIYAFEFPIANARLFCHSYR